jgi:hypothetical protein
MLGAILKNDAILLNIFLRLQQHPCSLISSVPFGQNVGKGHGLDNLGQLLIT